MKLMLEFEDGCHNCPAYDESCGHCLKLSEPTREERLPDCPAKLSPNDEIRSGEISALKAEIARLQAIVRGEV